MNFVDDSPSKFLQVLDGFFKVKAGLGMQYQLSDRLSLELNGDFNKVFSDKIDNEFQGTRDDYYYNFGFGLSYNFGFGKKNNEPTDNK